MSFNSYNTLPELLSMLTYAKEVLAKIQSRRSNDSMFIRQDDEDIKALYQKTSRLYMYISTLETFLKCSPLYPVLSCSCTNNDTAESNTISNELREKYKGIYNRLFSCIQLLIGSIPSHLYNNIEYDKDYCLTYEDIEDIELPCVEIKGDFNFDFSNDFEWGSSCESIPTPPSGGVVIYTGESTDAVLDASEIVAQLTSETKDVFIGEYNFAAGGYKYFVLPDFFHPVGFLDNGTAPMAMSLTLGTVVNGNTDFSYRTITINTVLYRVYRTLNTLGSPIMIEVE